MNPALQARLLCSCVAVNEQTKILHSLYFTFGRPESSKNVESP